MGSEQNITENLNQLSKSEFYSFMVEHRRNFIWTEEIIDKYQDKIDWNQLTYKYSNNILWTTSLLEKYKNSINWETLSEDSYFYKNSIFQKTGIENLYTAENLVKFAEYWNWKEITAHLNWSPDLIEACKEYIDWPEFINRGYNCDTDKIEEDKFTKMYYNMHFYKKYEKLIPLNKFIKSIMWKIILDKNKELFAKELLQVIYEKTK